MKFILARFKVLDILEYVAFDDEIHKSLKILVKDYHCKKLDALCDENCYYQRFALIKSLR